MADSNSAFLKKPVQLVQDYIVYYSDSNTPISNVQRDPLNKTINDYDGIENVRQISHTRDITENVVWGILRNLGNGCGKNNSITNPMNEVALMKRGDCAFDEKIENAKGQGFIGVILYNNVSSSNISNVNSLETDLKSPAGSVFIPAFYVSNEIGVQLLYSLNFSSNIEIQSNQQHSVRVSFERVPSNSRGPDGITGNRFTYFVAIFMTLFVAYMLFRTRNRRQQQEVHRMTVHLPNTLPNTQNAKQILLDPKILAGYPSKPYSSHKKTTEYNHTSSSSSLLPAEVDSIKTKTQSIAENDDQHTETDKNADVDKEQDYETCAVCLDDFVEAEQVKELPCAHIYHPNCIGMDNLVNFFVSLILSEIILLCAPVKKEQWLTQVSGICPMCKYDCVNQNSNETVEENNDANKDVVISINDGEPPVIPESSAQQSTSVMTINIAADSPGESSESKRSRKLRTREEDNDNKEEKDDGVHNVDVGTSNITTDPNEHAGDEMTRPEKVLTVTQL
ncbi:12817_t:CDS:2 [Ambispora gerdemannii]|uniref:RING-type E3 ubiquitin transferase n=1 Tax=Ambispora gerdemannii TaxID=144530 RepID=A0A9N8W0N8_9GLOM|nr:12817_t:CDS:2 [Ambispora gerdemannii]